MSANFSVTSSLTQPAGVGALVCVGLLTSWLLISRLKRIGQRYPPGPMAWPLLGNIPSLARSKMAPLDLLSALADEYGDIFRLRVVTTDIVILNDLGLIRDAFNHPDIQARPRITPIEDYLGRQNIGLAGSSGKVWREHRHFVHSAMRAMADVPGGIDAVVHAEAATLVEETGKTEGHPFDPHRVLNCAVSNIISALLFGYQYRYDDADFIRLQEIINDNLQSAASGGIFLFIPILARIPFSPASRITRGVGRFIQFSEKIVDAHRRDLDPERPRDIIDRYLVKIQQNAENTGSSFDEINLFVLIGDLFGASTETTNASLKWAILYMVTHPEIQRRVQDELDDVIGRDRLPTLPDRAKLPFTEATLSEIQRMGMAAPLGVAHACSADMKLAGYDIREGSLVVSNLWRLARDGRNWKDPDQFRPERFLNADGECMKRDELIPFSTGKRICVGESLARKELFVFFTSLLHRFTFKTPEGAPPPPLQGRLGLIYNPQDFQVCALKRD